MNKVPGPPKINKRNNKYLDILINTNKIQLGVILGVILGVPKVSGAQKVLRLMNTLYVQLITFWGVSL